MLRVERLSKRFRGGNYGVRDFSIELDGGVVGLLGPNGAGKTTLMQMLATITRPTEGRIELDGEDISVRPERLRSRLGYLPQDFGVYENLTAREFLTYIAALKGGTRRVGEMLEIVNLHTVADRLVGGFSGGMRQRLGIAQALINDPDFLIVDEPTAGLDPEERVRFRNILSEIGAGKLVILSTHIVTDVESVATEIAIMKHGSLVAFARPEELLQRTAGAVWKARLSSSEFDGARSKYRISGAIRKADGVHVRIVNPEKPGFDCAPAEPDLEDAFIFFMNFC